MEHAFIYSLSLLILVISLTIIVVTNKKYELKNWWKRMISLLIILFLFFDKTNSIYTI